MPGYCDPCPGKTTPYLAMGVSSPGASGGFFDGDDFPALISAASGTYMVGKLGRMALRTGGCQNRLQEIVRPSHVFSGFGMPFYWICHNVLLLFRSVVWFLRLNLELLQYGEPFIK